MADHAMAGFLDWIADRLVFVHGENPQIDYVLKLREYAERERLRMPPTSASSFRDPEWVEFGLAIRRHLRLKQGAS